MTEDYHKIKADQQQSKMVKGVAWATAGNFISRLLGVLYIIPWMAWLGAYRDVANAYFNMGYNIYALFLLISTVGIPVAVAKQIAKYNAMGKEDVSYYLVREFLKLMLIFGIIVAGIMYFSAPILANLSGAGNELVPVIRSLSWAVLFFPLMSVFRGVFQGTNNLRPSATSQIIEQLLRVIWILVTTFFIMKVGSGNYMDAVVQSTFAAFIGLLGSLVFLVYQLHKDGTLGKILFAKPSDQATNTLALVIETTKEAIPFVIIGSAFQLYQFVDQLTFVNTMGMLTTQSKEQLMTLYSYMTANPSKITMILIAVTGSIGSVAIALITENYIKKDTKATASLILNNLQMLLLFLTPAILGSVLLARPLYTVFYPNPSRLEIQLFVVNLLQIFVMGFYALFGTVIQSLFENRRAVLYFVYGFLVKVILQIPLILLLNVYGPLLATTIGLSVSIYLMYGRVHQLTRFNQKVFYKNSLLILIMSLLMALIVGIVEILLVRVIPVSSKVNSVIHLLIGGGLGVAVYGYLALLTRRADSLIGKQRAEMLRRKLRL